ncbi:MAG: serine/threonine-protein kinase, partial [Myxococcota bacterium]
MYPRTFGDYVLLERLGAGGMSEVDLARKSAGEGSFVRFLVIKRIRSGNSVDEQYVRMFQDEARINAELSHENIAQVYDFGREGDELYMAMEYVPGIDLRAVQLALAKNGKLVPVRIALTVLCGVLKALQYAHTRADQLGRPMNIVHRDVNPRNVMVSVNGEVKLIDFGVAKAADRLERTEGNALKGKFAYMAPEQIDGQRIDGRVDLYAVGLVLHELLTGKSPFTGLTDVQILHRILSGQIPPLPDGIDHPDLTLLRALHARALATRPEDRYRDADAMRADVEKALEPLGGPAPASWIGELVREAGREQVADIALRLKAYREDSLPNARRPAPAPPRDQSGTFNVGAIDEPAASLGWLPWLVGLGGGALGVVGVAGLVAAAAAFWFTRT